MGTYSVISAWIFACGDILYIFLAYAPKRRDFPML